MTKRKATVIPPTAGIEVVSPGTPQFVALADLHAHPWAAFARGDGTQNDRLQRTLKVLDASLAKAKALRCPWLFAGDLVHTAGYTLNVVLAALVEVFSGYPDVLKYAVWGNHDARGIGGKITLEQTVWAALARAVEGLDVLDPSLSEPLNGAMYIGGGLSLSGAGGQPRMDLFEYAAPADVGLYHGTVRGSVGPNGYVFDYGLEPAELWKRHRIAIVGDIHHPQHIDSPQGRVILIPGSPEQHNFGDAGEHGWWVVTLGSVGGKVDFVDSGSPRFLTVEMPGLVREDGHYYRVRTMGAGDVLPPNAIAIAPVPTTIAQRDVLQGAHGTAVLEAWLRETPPTGDTSAYLEAGKALLTGQAPTQLRPYRLTTLEILNFCSYEEQTFRVQDGTWLVLGHGRDFPSNGAGKSSLFEALFWLLFGRTTKGLTGDEVIRWGTTDCAVRARFLAPDNEELRVLRRRGERSELLVEGTNADGDWVAWEAASVNEMTDKLAAYLGLTPELFQALGYFSQERMLLFASATDGERKDMLADLIGLSAYQAASSAAAAQITLLQASSTRAEALRDAAVAQAEREWKRLGDAVAQSEQWVREYRERVRGAEAQLATFDAERMVAKGQLLSVAVADLTQDLDARWNGLLEQRTALEGMHAPLPAHPHTRADLEAARAQMQAMTMKVAVARQQMLAARETLATLQRQLAEQEATLAQGRCPTCLQPVSDVHRAVCLQPAQIAVSTGVQACVVAEAHLAHLLDDTTALKLQVDDIATNVTQGEQVAQWTERVLENERLLQQVTLDREQLQRVAAQHVEGVLTTKRAELERALAQTRNEKNPHAAEEVATRQRIAEAAKGAEDYAAQVAELAGTVAVYDYWRTGFSKQGIQSLLVDEVAALFNATRSLILPALTQGVYDVQFSTRSQTKAGEWRERTEFQVYEHGAPIPYAALSGGQRRRIDVGVMLTLVTAVARWMQVPGVLGVLVLDEVFGFLDASGAEGLSEALREVQAQIPAIYVISHDQQLQALFADVLLVVQDADGVSHVAEDGDGRVGGSDAAGRQRGVPAGAVGADAARDTDGARGAVHHSSARARGAARRPRVDRDAPGNGLLDVAREDGS